MTGKNAPVTDTELQILDVLWSSGPLRIRDITRALYPGGRPSEYATVQSLLERLESKGYIHRDRSSFAHIFSACVERTAFIGSQLQDKRRLTNYVLKITKYKRKLPFDVRAQRERRIWACTNRRV